MTNDLHRRWRETRRWCWLCCAGRTMRWSWAIALSEWTGHAPLLEEELALANIALDLIGQARALYRRRRRD